MKQAKPATPTGRLTSQRALILKYLRSVKTHPTAKKIYQDIKKDLPQISFGTIYRNLNILKEQNLIEEIPLEEGASRFDGNEEKHFHFICDNCGAIFDLRERHSEKIKKYYTGKIPGKITKMSVNFFGVCKKCKQKTIKIIN